MKVTLTGFVGVVFGVLMATFLVLFWPAVIVTALYIAGAALGVW